jgi:lipoprotein-anchoring transpeptidase ErfK/SrfK
MKGLYRMLFLVLFSATCLLLAACTSEPAAVSPTPPGDRQPTVAAEAADAEATEPAAEATAMPTATRAATTERAAVGPTQPGDSRPALPTELADAEATEPVAEPVAEPTAVPTATAIPTPRAAVTINGEALAYVQDNTLFIRALDGGEAIAVETCPEGSYCQIQYLKWSPDGQYLLYYYDEYDGPNASLRLADRQGNVQTVSDDIFYRQPGAWSPDGRAIAFFRPTGTYTEGSETEPAVEVHEVWTAAVGADGAVGELQLIGSINMQFDGCGIGQQSWSEALYQDEGGTSYGLLMDVTEWTATGILLYTLDCGNVGIGRFDMNSAAQLEPFDVPLRSLVLNNTRDRWYAVTGPSWPAETTDNQLATGTPDSLAVEIIPTSQPVELVFYGPVSGRLYYTAREVVERAELTDLGLSLPFYRSALWTINPDGTGEALLWQAEDHAFARVTERPDGTILFTRVENERLLYEAAQDATITDLSPYAPQRHIVQVPATGGEPAVVIANAGQPELSIGP